MANDVLDWLLEKENPSVRYFALRDLLDAPEEEADVRAARRTIIRSDPVKSILAGQQAEGFWVKPGWGYGPKYTGTDWQILFLAEFGADGRNRQVRKGCEYLLAHGTAPNGGFSAMVGATSSGAIICLNGNLVWALSNLGLGHDDRVHRAVEWMAGAITGEGFEHYYASGMTGPGFACVANGKKACAWSAVKALRALNAVPPESRDGRVQRAQQQTTDLLLSRNLARADYPYSERVSGEWFKFGFPLSYTSDVLEALWALAEAGRIRDPKLAPAIQLMLSKRDAQGRWALKHSLNGKMWADVEVKGQPSKWVTLRALRVLKRLDSNWSQA